MSAPKYPNVSVDLLGTDSNAFSIIGKTQKAMRRAGLSAEQIKEYVDEATSGDYDNVLTTTFRYVEVN